MNLGITVVGVHARSVLLNLGGEVVARAESTQADTTDAVVAAVRETLASAQGVVPDAVGLSFPDPDPGSWPTDLTFLAAAVGEQIPIKTVSLGNAAALAEMWYGPGHGVRDLIAFSIGSSVSAGVISNGTLLAGAHGAASSVAWLALNPVDRDDYRRLGCL